MVSAYWTIQIQIPNTTDLSPMHQRTKYRTCIELKGLQREIIEWLAVAMYSTGTRTAVRDNFSRSFRLGYCFSNLV